MDKGTRSGRRSAWDVASNSKLELQESNLNKRPPGILVAFLVFGPGWNEGPAGAFYGGQTLALGTWTPNGFDRGVFANRFSQVPQSSARSSLHLASVRYFAKRSGISREPHCNREHLQLGKGEV